VDISSSTHTLSGQESPSSDPLQLRRRSLRWIRHSSSNLRMLRADHLVWIYLSSTLIGRLIRIPESQATSSLPDFVPNTHPDEPSNPPESEEQPGSLEAGAGTGTRSRLPRRRAATPSGSSSRPPSPPRQISMPPDEETATTPAPRKVCEVFCLLLQAIEQTLDTCSESSQTSDHRD
jgi:hypothetical protein